MVDLERLVLAAVPCLVTLYHDGVRVVQEATGWRGMRDFVVSIRGRYRLRLP